LVSSSRKPRWRGSGRERGTKRELLFGRGWGVCRSWRGVYGVARLGSIRVKGQIVGPPPPKVLSSGKKVIPCPRLFREDSRVSSAAHGPRGVFVPECRRVLDGRGAVAWTSIPPGLRRDPYVRPSSCGKRFRRAARHRVMGERRRGTRPMVVEVEPAVGGGVAPTLDSTGREVMGGMRGTIGLSGNEG